MSQEQSENLKKNDSINFIGNKPRKPYQDNINEILILWEGTYIQERNIPRRCNNLLKVKQEEQIEIDV